MLNAEFLQLYITKTPPEARWRVREARQDMVMKLCQKTNTFSGK